MSGLQFFKHNEPNAVRFELAGKLTGTDVESLHQAWQREALNDTPGTVIVDITFITEADQHGRALLIVMHRFGTRVVADSPESSAIAQAILTEPAQTISKSGWFLRLLGLLVEDRGHSGTYPAAEMLRLTSAHRTSSFKEA